jgi:hypothetical protein
VARHSLTFLNKENQQVKRGLRLTEVPVCSHDFPPETDPGLDTRISKRSVNAFKSEGERSILWDNELRGFGLVAMRSGVKSYIINYCTKDGHYRRLTLGQHGRVTPYEARRLAKERLGGIAGGEDPAAERKKARKRKSTTFTAVAEEFIKKHVSKTRSADETGRVIRTYLLPRFGQMQITDIRRRDVAQLLDDIEAGTVKAANRQLLGGPVMADRVLAQLRTLMNWHATRDDEFTSPIVRGMSRTKPRERARRRVLTMMKSVRYGALLISLRQMHRRA